MTNEILVIDDNSDIRQLISGILKDSGFMVREAANFDQAMLEINKKLPDVAIIDVKLDKGDNDGIELLLNEFSDFARMPKPVLKKINLNKLISRSINLHKLSEAEIKFNLSKKNSSIEIDGDEDQLNRVFINLIKNSIESINEKKIKNADFKGKINVDIKDDSDYIYVTVEDNGLGFENTNKEKMVTPYFTTKKNGTGLGLAVVSKIISDHDSVILFNSIEDGAKVEITIPR